MRVATGRVVEGKVVVEDERLDEGSTVTVFLPESDNEIPQSPEEEAKLNQALKEADEGDFIEADAEQSSMSSTADCETPSQAYNR